MSDKKLNESKIVKDMDYVLVTLADGSVGQIAKSDLASVVAGQAPIKTNIYNENIPSGGRLDVPSSIFNVGLFVCDLANGSYCVGIVLNHNNIAYLTPKEKITQGVSFVRNGYTGVFSVINDSGTDLVGIKLRVFSNNKF